MRATIVAACLLMAASPSPAYELEEELRQRVERLIEAVQREPTTPATASERVAVVWEWANAVSVAGGFVPKNLPLLTVYAAHPMPGTLPPQTASDMLDLYVRQLALLDRDPDALGEVRVRAPQPIEPLSWQTIEVEWTVGSAGVDEGGGILVSNHFAGGYGRLQTEDPAADHYVSISASNPAVRFEHDAAPVLGPYGGFRSASDFPVYRVRGDSLSPGDVVTLVYGDRSRGSRGLQVGTFSNDAIALPVQVDIGRGEFYEIELPSYVVVGGRATGVHGFAPSIVAAGERFTISVRSEDRFTNRATQGIPRYEVLRNGEPVGELPPDVAVHELPVELESEGVYRFTFRSADGAIVGAANPVWVRDAPDEGLYWGETHGHCGFAEGLGTPGGYFRFARDDARLDFVTLSEHDLWMTDGIWRILNETSSEFQSEGEFLVYPGYEWTSRRQRGGHHNVFFRRPGFARVPVQEAPELTMLYRGLRARHATEDVLIIPHAHQAADWRLSDLDMERLVEIMSGHGTFEWFGQRYLEHGYRVGLVAASDDHRGHPGYSPGHSGSGERRSGIFQFGGLAGVWAPEKTRDAVFDALKARRAYATSGSQRIILDARLNGGRMGEQLDESREREIEGRAIGTTSLRRVDLVKNGEVIDGLDLGADISEGEATTEIVVGFHSQSWVDIRDNPRGRRNWVGKVSVEGARLEGARFLGTPTLASDRLEVDDETVAFDVATRGSSRTLALTVSAVSETTRLRFDIEATRETGTAPVQVRAPDAIPAASFALPLPGAQPEEKVLAVAPYRDRVSVERSAHLPDDVSFRFSDRGDPGDWYYVRVEQIDGHVAWSSPWWVGGEPPR